MKSEGDNGLHSKEERESVVMEGEAAGVLGHLIVLEWRGD